MPTSMAVYSPTATSVGATTFRPVDPDEGRPSAPEPSPASPRAPRDRVTLSADAKARSASPGGEAALTPEQERQVAELRARDAEVRAHEAAHQAGAGALGGGASFTYVMGPDGRRYAVGGEVPIQLRSGRTPDETIANAERVARAALAPGDPSAQDLAVAAAATRMAADARAQKAREATKAYAKARETAAGAGEEEASFPRKPSFEAAEPAAAPTAAAA